MFDVAFLVFLFVVSHVLVWFYHRNKVGDRAVELYNDWIHCERAAKARIWGFVEGANKRRKTVEEVLRRERRRHSRTAADAIALIGEREELQARVNGLEVEIAEERSRYRALAAETIDKLVGRETKANVVAGLMRKIRQEEE